MILTQPPPTFLLDVTLFTVFFFEGVPWPAELSLERYLKKMTSHIAYNKQSEKKTLISPKGSMQNVMIIKLSSTKWFSKIDDAWALLYGSTNQFKETQHL